MKARLRAGRTHSRSGAALLFMVMLIAVIAMFLKRMIPKAESGFARNKFRVNAELDEMARAMTEYYFDKKAKPTFTGGYMIDTTNFIQKFLSPGVNYNATVRSGSCTSDEFAGYASSTGPYRGSTATQYATIYSVGPNLTSNSGASDDIVRVVYMDVAAASRTRRILDMSKAAWTYWRGKGGTPTGTWKNADRVSCSLGADFESDGWGQQITENAGRTACYSYGPNQINNSAASDDISW